MITELEPNKHQKTINIQQEKQQPNEINHNVPQEPKQVTYIEQATSLVDGITGSLYYQIMQGLQSMYKKRAIPCPQESGVDTKKKSILVEKTIDIDQHKRMVHRFMSLNRKIKLMRQQRSIELVQSSRKFQEDEEKRQSEQRSKTIELRREEIVSKLKKKEEMMREIKRSIVQVNKKFEAVKKNKCLYIQKEQAYKREYILPKLEEERKIIQRKKAVMKPMDMTILLQHEKHYAQKLKNDRANRSLTSRVLQIENHYDPPKYVPKSFMIMEAEESLKKDEEKMKTQQLEINEYRKKQFLRVFEERQKNQLQKLKERDFEKSKRSMSLLDTINNKEKTKIQLSREQTKKKGDQYMKSLIAFNKHRKKHSKTEIKTNTEVSSNKASSEKQKPKTQYEVELIKEQKIERFHRIRVKVIDDIVNNEHIDKAFKLQKLNFENTKIDQLVSAQQRSNKSENKEAAVVYLSSIHTKLAILEIGSPKKSE